MPKAKNVRRHSPTRNQSESKNYDTRRTGRLLERSTQLEVGSLLLPSRSKSDSAQATQVDGLDGQRSASQRYSGHVPFAGRYGRSGRCFQRSRHRYRASGGRCEHCSRVFALLSLRFKRAMESLTPNEICRRTCGFFSGKARSNASVHGQRGLFGNACDEYYDLRVVIPPISFTKRAQRGSPIKDG